MTKRATWWGPADLGALIDELRVRGVRVIGPRLQDGSVTLAEVARLDDLPAGWVDDAAPGSYRVRQAAADDPARERIFAHRVGATSWKRFLHPPSVTLVRSRRGADGTLSLTAPPHEQGPVALLGVRPCDVAALGILDRVLLADGREDPVYAARRRAALVIAVDCVEPGATCFCASMGAGPAAGSGFDLALTELLDGDVHGFVVRSGSERGEELLAAVGGRAASAAEKRDAKAALEAASDRMGRRIDAAAVRDALRQGLELPTWNRVAERCLACTNCTQVCPTCFCTTVEDATDLTGLEAERRRTWDSCFTTGFSYIHGGSVRTSGGARYRQWLSHKFSTWYEQFGTAGCVGCGRCIAWCPVGIDVTQEGAAVVSAVAAMDAAAREAGAARGRRPVPAGGEA